MTVEQLKANLKSILSVGNILKQFIPGDVDDRVLEYLTALSDCDPLLQLIVDDFLADDGPFGSLSGEVIVLGDDGQPHSLDPATIALIVQLITTFGPVLLEWIKNRRNR